MIVKIIECGSPIALGNVITICIKENSEQDEITKKIINTMSDIGKKTKAKLLIIRDFYKKDINLGKFLKDMVWL